MNVTMGMDDLRVHRVNRQDGVTLWRQIAGQIQGDIASGTCKPGHSAPDRG